MSASTSSSLQPFRADVVHDVGEVAVVLTGELDLASAGALEREVRDLRRMGFDRVVVDLRDVDFIDSTGLRVLLSLRNTAKCKRHSLIIVPGAPRAQRIFDLTATRGMFDWRD